MQKVYNVGIIGYGGMAGFHFWSLNTFRDKDNIKVYGVYDLDESRIKAAIERGKNEFNMDIVGYSSREELLSDPNIDIVLVATTNEVHKEIVIDAMRHDKHVICEKPVTLSSEELLECMEVAKETGKVFTIDQNRRTNKDFLLMSDVVKSGKLGKVYHIESRVEGSRGMPTGWRTLKHLGGGMMLDWGVHLIDQLMHFNASAVTNVYCKMFSIDYPEVDDNFHLSLTFEDGLSAFIEVATNNYITKPRWYMLGTDGTAKINSWECDGEIVRVIDKDNSWDEQIFMTAAGPTKTMAPRRPESVERIELTMPDIKIEELRIVYKQMLDAIESRAELTIKPEQALRVMRVMEAAFESAKTGNAINTNI
ncbi:MAG: Gfo/Idh/MocA family oxidoreductase [Clostridia bacterium]|nr:Gfo/Idh/MocA family oxidoreductase [Clostridia bacterium]